MKEQENVSSRRLLEVYEKYFAKVAYRSVVLPEIHLRGKWLRDTGFSFGSVVTVHHQKNKIVITLEEVIGVSSNPQPVNRHG